MCGIAGYVDFSYGAPLAQVLAAMAHALRRRGPDAQSKLVDGTCGLAHARLSIIDIEGSPQPMRVPGSDVSLVYNGELYNYLELREEMSNLGAQFSTRGDTEVLLRWIGREWERALPRFDGMFGFAAWDRRRERLLLARDPYGEKPLFYAAPESGVIVFGSEIKALLKHPAVHAELDQDALRQVLRFRAVYGTRSLYRGIRQLEPGCYLEFSRDGARLGRFYDAAKEIERARHDIGGLSDQRLIQRGEALLVESVRQRMIADVPVGAFLSGGLDSSLIVALMRQLRGPDAEIHTFSVGFRDDPSTELPHAKLVADAMRSRHTEVHVGEEDYIERLAELTACRDAPISEPSDVAIAQMSRRAKQSVKVVLSGEGADEVFAGYPKYAFANVPSVVRGAARAAGADRLACMAQAFGLNHRRSLVAARALTQRNELDRLVQWFSHLDRLTLESLSPGLEWDNEAWQSSVEPQQSALNRVPAMGPLARMQFLDMQTWLPGNLLERGDRMTMAEGLECRPPFLDRELASFGLALPDRMKVRGFTGKLIVRHWARRLLPSRIIVRKKWGFRVPLAQWFRGRMRDWLFGYLTSERGICGTYGDRSAVRSLIEAHLSGRTDANLTLWTLLVAEVWFQNVFRSNRDDSVAAVPVPIVA
jgi:asparagine synthase (glutamine-hydrolysing)